MDHRTLLRRRRLAAAWAAALAAGCADSAVAPGRTPDAIAPASAPAATAIAGQALPEPLVVKATDARGEPVAGAEVVFTVIEGGGTITPASATTGGGGEAHARWTLGTAAGPNRVNATAKGRASASVTFVVDGTAGPAATLEAVSPATLAGVVGQTLATPIAARVADANGNPIAGATVAFDVTAGGGAATPAVAITDARGEASAAWTLGATEGANAVVASSPAVAGASVSFAAAGSAPAEPPSGAGRLAAVGGTALSGTAGQATAVTVMVTDAAGAPTAGAAVTFTVTGGKGSVSPATAATGATGEASTSWTLASEGGINILTATAAGAAGSPVTFIATAAAPGGTPPVEPTPPPAPGEIVGRVREAFSLRVIAGATVRLGPAGGAFMSSATTDADGVFSFADLAAGSYKLEVTVDAFRTNGAPNVVVADGVVARADFALVADDTDEPLRVAGISGRVTDAAGAPLAGATVTASGGAQTNGVFSAVSTADDGTYAITGVSLDDAAGDPIGTFTVTASAAGFSSRSSAVALADDQTTSNVDFLLAASGPQGTTFFADDFEAATGWAASGFWNRSTLLNVVNRAFPAYVSLAPDDASAGKLPAPRSGSHAFWYGDPTSGNYLGAQSADDEPGSGGTSDDPDLDEPIFPSFDTLTSPAFTVPESAAQAVLRFDTWFEVQNAGADGGIDMLQVDVRDADSGERVSLGSLNAEEAPGVYAPDVPFTSGGANRAPLWRTYAADLSGMRGKRVQLVFTFLTTDAFSNGFRGWIVDDVRVTDEAISAARASSRERLLTKAAGGTARPLTLRRSRRR